MCKRRASYAYDPAPSLAEQFDSLAAECRPAWVHCEGEFANRQCSPSRKASTPSSHVIFYRHFNKCPSSFRHWMFYHRGSGMTDVMNDELPRSTVSQRFWAVTRSTILFASPIISVGCAVIVGCLVYEAVNRPAPADVSALAISILRSANASPEMKDWATGALGLQPYTPIHRTLNH